MNRPRNLTATGWTMVGMVALLAVSTGAVAAAIALGDGTPRTLRAVALAATTCICGGIGGWVVSRWPTKNPALAVATGLGAVSLRIFMPLAALGWVQFGDRELREGGAGRFILVFYLLLLATDIFLNIMGAGRTGRSGWKNVPD